MSPMPPKGSCSIPTDTLVCAQGPNHLFTGSISTGAWGGAETNDGKRGGGGRDKILQYLYTFGP